MCRERVFRLPGYAQSVSLRSLGLRSAHVSNSTSRAQLPSPLKIPAYVTSKGFRPAHTPTVVPVNLSDKATSVYVRHISTWSSASLLVSQYVGQLGLCYQRWLLLPQN